MDPSDIERTYNIIKQQTCFLMSLHMRTNGKCNYSITPYHWLKRYTALRQNSIFLKNQNMHKYNTISIYVEKFYQLHAPQRQLLQPLIIRKKDSAVIENLQYRMSQNELNPFSISYFSLKLFKRAFFILF